MFAALWQLAAEILETRKGVHGTRMPPPIVCIVVRSGTNMQCISHVK